MIPSLTHLAQRSGHELRVFATSVTYFTGFPLDFLFPTFKPSDQELAECIRYFGIMGLMIGTVAAGVFVATEEFWNPAVAGILALTAGSLATRALHEDGIADFADALGGAYDRDSALRIMKDPHHGTYGVLALWTVMTLKWQFVVLASNDSVARSCAALVFAHVLSRVGTWCLVSASHDARRGKTIGAKTPGSKSGVIITKIQDTATDGDASPSPLPPGDLKARGGFFSRLGGTTKFRAPPGAWIHLGLVGSLGLWMFTELLCCLVLGAVVVLCLRRFLVRWIGGYTGDCLGACQQILELVVLGLFSFSGY